jgi:hypothetical protein
MTIRILIVLLSITVAHAGALDETRYCTDSPLRDDGGVILRRTDVLRAFRELHPCPSTWLTRGACPEWNIDHVIPLAVGGCDEVSNLQWLPTAIKRCAGQTCKDRWERKVYDR